MAALFARLGKDSGHVPRDRTVSVSNNRSEARRPGFFNVTRGTASGARSQLHDFSATCCLKQSVLSAYALQGQSYVPQRIQVSTGGATAGGLGSAQAMRTARHAETPLTFSVCLGFWKPGWKRYAGQGVDWGTDDIGESSQTVDAPSNAVCDGPLLVHRRWP